MCVAIVATRRIVGRIYMADITICLGVNCKIRTKCGRYGIRSNNPYQSYMASCVDKVAFIGKKPFKKIY